MVELPQYVAMSPDDYHFQRGLGNVGMGSFVDHVRQPGVVGVYRNGKPIFLYLNDEERVLLESGNLEGLFAARGYKNAVLANELPEGPKTTIP